MNAVLFQEKKTEGYFQKKERERVNKLSILCFGGDQYIYICSTKENIKPNFVRPKMFGGSSTPIGPETFLLTITFIHGVLPCRRSPATTDPYCLHCSLRLQSEEQ
jgi:hypothetical protein